jgi:hypothetical protein
MTVKALSERAGQGPEAEIHRIADMLSSQKREMIQDRLIGVQRVLQVQLTYLCLSSSFYSKSL